MSPNSAIASRWFKTRAPMLVVAVIGVVALNCLVARGLAQERSRDSKSALAGFPDLVSGLKATPGCLGVETAQTASGKNVIFAWFEDKKAVLKWYYSDMHQGVMNSFFPHREAREPLKGVPDDSGPIMAIASITMADKGHFTETQLPISQIAIELYQPLAGGVFLGGRFAPESLKVPSMRDYTPKAK